MQPLDLPLRFTRGDDARIHLTFQVDGAPFNLTDYVVTAVLRKGPDASLPAVATFDVTLDNTAGEVTLGLEEEVTADLAPRLYWSLLSYHPATDLWQTWLAGNVRVDFQAEDADPNDYTINIGPTEVTVVVAANIGPTGPKGDTGDPGQQGTTGIGVPSGGTTDQALVKASATDFDTEWADVAGGGGAPPDATYLTTTANGSLTAEVVVGTTPQGELGGTWASPTVNATHSGSAHLALGTSGATAAAGDHAHAGAYDPAGSAAAAQSASQPLDSDLTALAALTTTAFGRALLELANAGAGRTAFGLGTAATSATGDFDAAGAAASAQAASQPLDSDLTALAALSTTAYGRSFLETADAAAARTLTGAPSTTDTRFDRVKRIGTYAPTISSLANTTAQQTLASLTIPAAEVATDDLFVLDVSWDLMNNSGGAVTYLYELKYGTQSLGATNALSVATSSARIKANAKFFLLVTGSAAQRSWGTLWTSFAGAQLIPAPNTGVSGVHTGSTTADMTTDKAFFLGVTMGTANALAEVRPYAGILTRYR